MSLRRSAALIALILGIAYGQEAHGSDFRHDHRFIRRHRAGRIDHH